MRVSPVCIQGRKTMSAEVSAHDGATLSAGILLSINLGMFYAKLFWLSVILYHAFLEWCRLKWAPGSRDILRICECYHRPAKNRLRPLWLMGIYKINIHNRDAKSTGKIYLAL